MTNGAGTDKKKPRKRDYARWVLVGLLAVAALAIVSATYVSDAARICRQEAGDTAAITVCGPFGLGDALWLALVVLVIFLLLWPDVSEVSVTGIGSLKRRVEEQEKKTAELERFVVSQMLDLSIRNTQTQNTTVVLSSRDLREARDKVEEQQKGLAHAQAQAYIAPPVDPDRAVKQARVLELWEAMADVFATVTGERRYRGRPDPEGRILIDHPRLLAWYREYSEPFQTFRAARDSVVHRPSSLANEDLDVAVQLGDSLMTSLGDAVASIGGGS
jgi:hypothetical protein